jgi:uncharacterized SAM-binding protein YcdF (DUF218 family)
LSSAGAPSARGWESAARGFAVGGLIGILAKDLGLASIVSYWSDHAPLVAAFAAVGALAWGTRFRPLFATAAAGLGLLWLVVAFSPLSNYLAKDLVRRDPLGPADAVFVLNSGIQRDGELTTSAMSRLLHGLELLGQDRAPRLVLSELSTPDSRYAAAARALMDRLGLQHEIVTVGPVRNTHDEAVAVGALFRQRGWRRVLAVTSPAHSRRASACLEREGLEVISSPSTETQYDFEMLTRPDDRLRALAPVLHERLGLYVYRRRSWIAPEAQ